MSSQRWRAVLGVLLLIAGGSACGLAGDDRVDVRAACADAGKRLSPSEILLAASPDSSGGDEVAACDTVEDY